MNDITCYDHPRTALEPDEIAKINQFMVDNGFDGADGVLGFIRWLQEVCHNTSERNGFWDADPDVGDGLIDRDGHACIDSEKIALMHSELSEALETLRENGINAMSVKIPHHSHVGEELADCIVRILDFCGRHEIPVLEIMLLKMAYNATRPYKHGKNF